MNELQGFREKYPQYNDMPDSVLADSLYTKYYSDMPRNEYFGQLGITEAAPPKGSMEEAGQQLTQAGRGASAYLAKTGESVAASPELARLATTSFIAGLPNLVRATQAELIASPQPPATETPSITGQKEREAAQRLAESKAFLKPTEAEAAQRSDVSAGIAADIAAATPKDQTFPGEVISMTAQSAPAMLAGVATGMTAGPAAGVAVGVGAGATQQAVSSLEEPGASTAYALRTGLYEALGEFAGMKAILAPAKTLLNRVVRAVATNFSEEAATQLAQDIDAKLHHNPDITVGEIVHNFLLAGSSGVLGAGVMAPVAHAAQTSQQAAAQDQMVEIARQDMERAIGRKIAPEDAAWRLLQPIQPTAPLDFGKGVEMPLGARTEPGALGEPTVGTPPPLPGVFQMGTQVTPTETSNPYVRMNELGQQLISLGTQPVEPLFGAETTLQRVVTDMATVAAAEGQKPRLIELQKIAGTYLDGPDETLAYLAENFLNKLGAAESPAMHARAATKFAQALQKYSADLGARAEGKAFDLAQTSQVSVWMDTHGGVVAGSDRARVGQRFEVDTKLNPGEVIALNMPREMAQVAVNLISRWAKLFLPNTGIVVVQGSGYRLGAAWIDNHGHAVIELNPEYLLDDNGKLKSGFAETIAHELGHHIGAALFRASPPEIQQAILNAWHADNIASLDQTTSEFTLSRRGPAWLELYPWGSNKTTVRLRIANEYALNYSAGVRDYYMNFDEWMAHNFERILAGDVYRWQSPMRRFMMDAFRKFKALFEVYKQEFAPNETFKKFLDYHIARNQVELQAQRLNAVETGLQFGAGAPATAADEAQSAQRLVLSTIPEEVGKPVGNFLRWGERSETRVGEEGEHVEWSAFKRVTYTLLQVAKLNPHMKELYDPAGVRDPQTGAIQRGYIDYVLEWARERMAWMNRADERLHQWRNLSRAEQQALARFTYAQVEGGKYLNTDDLTVRQQYSLTDQVIEMSKRLDGDFKAFITAMEDTLREEAMKRLALNPFAQQELLNIKKRFDELRAKPYAPMVRYGEYVIKVAATRDQVVDGKTYKKGDTIYREHFDTKRQRDAAVRQIRGMFPSGELKLDRLAENIRSIAGMPGALLDSLKDRLGLTDEQKKELQQYAYEIAPAQSFVKRLMQRRGVLGYSFDLQRSYANYFFHGANHIARVKYHELLRDAISRMDSAANALGGDVTNRREISNYLRRHFDYLMNPQNDWAGLRGAIAISYLGGIIKTAWVNLTQVALVTYPHLAEKYGDVAAIAAIQRAYGDQYKAYRVLRPMGVEQEAALNKWVAGQALSASEERYIKAWSGMDAAKRDALLRAQREGFIDESQAMELAAMSEGNWLARFKATDELGYYVRTLGQQIMVPFQLAEKVNRRVTFMAAYDLAVKEGLEGDAAFQAARDAVSSTQFEYAKWNRPEALRGKKGVFLMFMQYNLNNLHLATNGFSPNVTKWNWRWWALMLATGGAAGLPFAENMMDLAEWALLKLYPNERINIKHELKKLVGELAENIQSAPDIFLHGLSRYGFGMVPFADVSGSISMGRLIPGTDVLLASAEGASWNDALAKAVTESGGATSALVLRMMQALASNDPDIWKRIEKGLPMTEMQNISAALRWYQRGAEETGKGGNIVTFDPSDPWQAAEIAGKALGFTPQRLATAREDLYIKQDMARYYTMRKTMLMNAVDEARQHGDMEAVTRAVEAVRDFNKEVPIRGLGITGDELKRSIISREKARALQDEGEGTTKTEQIIGHAIKSGKL